MTVYKSLAEAPGPVDLAVVIVPARAVPGVMDEIGKRGIRHAILMSAGFAETGEEGRGLQEEAAAAARKHKIRVIGPNCVGVINTANRFATVEAISEAMTPGPLAIIAQSGVFGNVLLDSLYQKGLFLSKGVTVGNRMDVDECEVLDYLHRDPQTGVIMMYIEGAAHGRSLVETLSRVTRDKPVLVLKSGRSEEGRAATASHTGSLSGEDRIYDAALAQGGAIRAQSLSELTDLARVFSTQPLPAGNRLGIITTSGSLGALATDVAVHCGLRVPPLAASTVEAVLKGAPAWMNVRNPLDVGPSGQYHRALSALLEDPGLDMFLLVTIIPFSVVREFKPMGLTPKVWFGDIAEMRAKVPDKPMVVCAVGNSEFVEDMVGVAGPGTPVFTSPEPAARALAAMWRHQSRTDQGRD